MHQPISFWRWLVVVSMVFGIVAFLLWCLFTSIGYAAHGSWHDRYTGAGGMLCCGPTDCYVVHARLLDQDREHVRAEVDGVELDLPTKAVHTLEDEHDWVCHGYPQSTPLTSEMVRCLFIASGM